MLMTSPGIALFYEKKYGRSHSIIASSMADRTWPRGTSKEKVGIDLWMKEIAPSDQLRKWSAHETMRRIKFQRRYREELKAKTALTEQLRELEKTHRTVTLIYSARNEYHNQAVLLFAVLQKSG